MIEGIEDFMHKIKKFMMLSFMICCIMQSSVQALDDTTKAFIAGVCVTIAAEAVIVATPIVMYLMSKNESLKKENNSLKENHVKRAQQDRQQKEQALKELQAQKAEEQREHDRIYLMSC